MKDLIQHVDQGVNEIDIAAKTRSDSDEEVTEGNVVVVVGKTVWKKYWQNMILYDGLLLEKGRFRPEDLRRFRRLPFTGDDVVVASYPGTGSEWLRAIILALTTRCDATSARSKLSLDARIPLLESRSEDPAASDKMDEFERTPAPRLANTRLPVRYLLEHLDNGTRAIVWQRNVKDSAVSYYQRCLASGFRGDWDHFFEAIRDGAVAHGDYFEFYAGYRGACQHLSNVLFVSYEEACLDMRALVEKIAYFVGVREINTTFLERVVSHVASQHQTMSHLADPLSGARVPKVTRRDVVGEWKSYLSKQQSEYFDKKSRKHFGINVQFEL